jgi:osmoprotectant transport system ATP-binding protein
MSSSTGLPARPSELDNIIIEFKNASLTIGARTVLDDVSFQIRRGEMLVLLGRSGSGKTTILKLINGLLKPTAGEVFFDGKSTASWDPIRLRRQIGYVIQEAGLFPHYTVGGNVGLVPSLEGWPEDRIAARVTEMLNLVGLDADDFLKRFPRELSGGQRQRVGVARALAADPPVLLLDEPFGALDPITRTEIRREFRELQQRVQKTMVFVTHDVREAFQLATAIALIKDGRVIAFVEPNEFAKLDHPEARAFVESLE